MSIYRVLLPRKMPLIKIEKWWLNDETREMVPPPVCFDEVA
jgi:hypothetical protein